MFLLSLVPFALGTVVASYVNVLVFRYETNESTAKGRSRCGSCKKTIAWYDNIPILSYLILWGRCRNCNARISLQYPLVEIAGGVLFLLSYLHVSQLEGWSFLVTLSFEWALWTILLAATVHDLREMIIPDRYSYSFIFLGLSTLFINYPELSFRAAPLWEVAAGPIVALPIFLLWAGSRGRAMGFADIKIALGMGWLLGLAGGLSALVYSFWIGAVVSVLLLLSQYLLVAYRKKQSVCLSFSSEVPFGPHLVMGTAVVWFAGITLLELFAI